jgi:hypothetical protein
MLIKASGKVRTDETGNQVLYGPDVKLRFLAVCYTDDVSYEHVGYWKVGSLTVDRLRAASWLCPASGNRTSCCSITTLCEFRLHCTFTACLSYVCHNTLIICNVDGLCSL